MLDPKFENEIVEKLGDYEFTRRELRAAFDKVADPENWKNPIERFVSLRSERERIAIHVAVRFFAGCSPIITRLRGEIAADGVEIVKVKADGYYVAVGA